MGQASIAIVYIGLLVLAVLLGLRSLRGLLALRKEGSQVKDFYEHELAREIREAIVSEIGKKKTAVEGAKVEEKLKEDPLAGLLMEIYDDLYTRIAEEEAVRKKSIEELKGEIEKLRSGRGSEGST